MKQVNWTVFEKMIEKKHDLASIETEIELCNHARALFNYAAGTLNLKLVRLEGEKVKLKLALKKEEERQNK